MSCIEYRCVILSVSVLDTRHLLGLVANSECRYIKGGYKMSVSKFKVGDRVVRTTRNHVTINKVVVGSIWTIIGMRDGFLNFSEIDDTSFETFHEDYFKLYEEPKKFSGKFKVSDKESFDKVVKYLKSIGCELNRYIINPSTPCSSVYIVVIEGIILGDSPTTTNSFFGLQEVSKLPEYSLEETVTYSHKLVPETIPETIEILGKKYLKEDVEKAFSTLKQVPF